MKRNCSGKKDLLLICLMIAAAILVSGQAANATAPEGMEEIQVTEDVEVTEVPPEVKNGWEKTKSGKRYYKNGEYVTGWKEIGKYKYYFNSKGIMQRDKMISKNKYVDKKGHLIPKSKIYSKGKKALKKLEKKLKDEIKKYSGTHSIYIKNLDTNEYLVINNKQMKPASVIKLYNMAAVYDQIDKGKLKESDQIKGYLKSMITVSSNDAYNELLKKIGQGDVKKGIQTVSKLCKDKGYKNTSCGATLTPSYFQPQVWIGGNLSTVQDCGHILEDIYRGNLVSKKVSKKMLDLLKAQQRKGKIPAGLPKGVKSANKTGEYESRQHDAAIVFSKKADYIIVVMTEGDSAAISHIQKISSITYKYFN